MCIPRGRGRPYRTVARSQTREDHTTTPRWRATARIVLFSRERPVSRIGQKKGKSTTCEPSMLQRSAWSRPTCGQRSACTSSPRRDLKLSWPASVSASVSAPVSASVPASVSAPVSSHVPTPVSTPEPFKASASVAGASVAVAFSGPGCATETPSVSIYLSFSSTVIFGTTSWSSAAPTAAVAIAAATTATAAAAAIGNAAVRLTRSCSAS